MKNLLKKFHNILQTVNQDQSAGSSDLRFDEQFAIKRFWKKFEVPADDSSQELHLAAWDTFLSTDEGLKLPSRVDGLWYKVREELHGLSYHLPKEIKFPKGSEFIATRGNNSLEARLCQSEWTVTHDCFEAFGKCVYGHKALKRAFRKRYHNWCLVQCKSIGLIDPNVKTVRKNSLEDYLALKLYKSSLDDDLFSRFVTPYEIFIWKLERVCSFEFGSRFSTVPKNNLVRRPINIECFGNMIAQKRIGDTFRGLVKDFYGNDLSHLQDEHKARLSDNTIATIDLKNASDSINFELVKFLLPKGIVSHIERSRSEYILGPDDSYYPLKKVSSMGNGFTFELMTLILTSLCRQLDPNSSVYGDDIIISKDVAPRLIEALTDVGFQVNLEKSFIDGPFRESCGGNYHDELGYIESYDFTWPENIHDCIVFYNKAKQLNHISLFHHITTEFDKVIPDALRGPDSGSFKTIGLERGWDNASLSLGTFFRQGKTNSWAKFAKQRREIATRYHYDINSVVIHLGWRFTPSLRSKTLKDLKHNHWAKYEMYLSAGSVTKDTITGDGSWDKVVLCTVEGRTSTLSSILS